ncbi:hypothetical protein SB782_36790, partial [Brevibacillus sp. SIMBA_076]|uniref:hypothetical protein n=1 Tax=Brevibacillus sp. SIMBA_076 TaxID=3085814 RepID=UPI003978949D
NVTRSTHGLLLLPSLHLAPHIVIKGGGDYPAVVHYPPRNERSVVFTTVTQRLKAMNDPTRQIIVRELIRQPRPTVELAIEMR